MLVLAVEVVAGQPEATQQHHDEDQRDQPGGAATAAAPTRRSTVVVVVVARIAREESAMPVVFRVHAAARPPAAPERPVMADIFLLFRGRPATPASRVTRVGAASPRCASPVPLPLPGCLVIIGKRRQRARASAVAVVVLTVPGRAVAMVVIGGVRAGAELSRVLVGILPGQRVLLTISRLAAVWLRAAERRLAFKARAVLEAGLR